MAITETKQASVRRTTFPLHFSRIFSTTPGVLVPVHSFVTIPDDSLSLATRVAIDTLPVETPAYTKFRAQIRYFWTDFRAYIPELMQDVYGLDPTKVSLPVMPAPLKSHDPLPTSDYYINADSLASGGVAPSSLLNHLGLPVGAQVVISSKGSYNSTHQAIFAAWSDRLPSMFPVICYYHAYYKYYMNPQQPLLRMITGRKETGRDYVYYELPGDNLATRILNATKGLFYETSLHVPQREPYAEQIMPTPESLAGVTFGSMPSLYTDTFSVPYGGLAILPYLPSVLESWMDSTRVDKVREASVLDTSNGLSLDSLIAKDKLRKYLSLGLFGNAGYESWVYAQFGVRPTKNISSPQYMGGSDFMINFSTVVAQSADGLGELGGKGDGSGVTSQRKYFFDSYGIFQVLFDVRPILNYSEGLDEQMTFNALSSLPSYETSGLPFEVLRARSLSALPRIYSLPNGQGVQGVPILGSDLSLPAGTVEGFFDNGPIGYQVAWTPYRSFQNRSFGLLSPGQSLESWTQNRRYSRNGIVTGSKFDASTYIRLEDMNSIFVDRAYDAANFIVSVTFDGSLARALSNDAVPTF